MKTFLLTFYYSDYRKHLFFNSKINDIILKVSKNSSGHKSQTEKLELEKSLCQQMQEDIDKLKKSLDYKFFILPHLPDTPFHKVK